MGEIVKPLILKFNNQLTDTLHINIPTKGFINDDNVELEVDWGDNSRSKLNTSKLKRDECDYICHTYRLCDEYIVKIYGNIKGFGDITYKISSTLTEIIDFGDSPLESFKVPEATFLRKIPDKLPSSIIDISYLFAHCKNFNDSNICKWDTSNIIDMKYAFFDTQYFNQNVSNWNFKSLRENKNVFKNTYSLDDQIRYNTELKMDRHIHSNRFFIYI